ncbi:MAG: anti-CBASS Acb1 family protein [Acetobacteraceae bacterium]
MAEIKVTGSALGTPLQQLLMADSIEPGSDVGYQLAKLIYLYHPLGAKMADAPVSKAMSQARDISIPDSPEDLVREAFLKEWKKLKADENIAACAGAARIYGIGAIVFGGKDIPTDQAIEPDQLPGLSIYFNVLDPLNTAGSLVLNQNPNAPDFQKPVVVTAAGQPYHRSRAVVLMNERPIYIAYTNSAFGFVGRSVYQRALFPLKSFIQSMITDDMVTRKAGVLIAKIAQPGSIIDNIMKAVAGIKRQLVREAQTDNVISVAPEESIESLDLQNVDKASESARRHILENVAAAADMPAKMLNQETFAEGFGEGTEDAKDLAQYIDRVRIWMQPAYDYFDRIAQHRAWSPEFYKTIQAAFPKEYGEVAYVDAFYRWRNSFTAEWPSLLIEPDSERSKTEKVKQEAIVDIISVVAPLLDPENKARLLDWAALNIGENKILFPNPLEFDLDELRAYVPPTQPAIEPGEGERADAASRRFRRAA